MSAKETVIERIVVGVLGLLGLGGFVWLGFWVFSQTPTVPPGPPSDVKIVSGSRKDLIVVTHDSKRFVTCYVDTMHGGIACFGDDYIEHNQREAIRQDGGLW